MWRFLLALLVLVGAGGGAWVLLNDPVTAEDRAATPEEVVPTDFPARIEPDLPLAPFEDADEPRAAALPTPTPAPVEPQGLEDGAVPEQPVGDFSWKFGERGEDELAQQLVALEDALRTQLEREWRKRFDDGRFEEHAVDADDGRTADELAADLGADDPLCCVRPILDPASLGAGAAKARLLSARVVRLTREEFPDLAAQLDERTWLRGRLGVRAGKRDAPQR